MRFGATQRALRAKGQSAKGAGRRAKKRERLDVDERRARLVELGMELLRAGDLRRRVD